MEYATLEQISNKGFFKDGDWIESKDQDENGNVRLLQLADIGVGNFINKSSKFINKETFLKLKCNEILQGDILIARMPDPIGRSCVFKLKDDFKYITAVDVAILRVNDDVDNRFVCYMLNSTSLLNESLKQSTGATRKRISRRKLAKFKIPLPNLETQKKIAAILDEADKLRQLNKQLIAKYDALTQSLFLDMFGDPVTNPKGWKSQSLGEILDITSSKRIFKSEYKENGIPFYRTKEIVELSKGNKISLELFISKERYDDIKSNFEIPQVGDILLSAVGTIGVMWTIDTNEPFYFKDGNLVWLKSSKVKGINPTHLRMTLDYLIAFEKHKLAEGGSYAALTIAKLKVFKVLLAPIQLQNQFAERVQIIENQKQQAQNALQKSENLFNSLLQKAFKDELVK